MLRQKQDFSVQPKHKYYYQYTSPTDNSAARRRQTAMRHEERSKTTRSKGRTRTLTAMNWVRSEKSTVSRSIRLPQYTADVRILLPERKQFKRATWQSCTMYTWHALSSLSCKENQENKRHTCEIGKMTSPHADNGKKSRELNQYNALKCTKNRKKQLQLPKSWYSKT
jgi:hypothetical protein